MSEISQFGGNEGRRFASEDAVRNLARRVIKFADIFTPGLIVPPGTPMLTLDRDGMPDTRPFFADGEAPHYEITIPGLLLAHAAPAAAMFDIGSMTLSQYLPFYYYPQFTRPPKDAADIDRTKVEAESGHMNITWEHTPESLRRITFFDVNPDAPHEEWELWVPEGTKATEHSMDGILDADCAALDGIFDGIDKLDPAVVSAGIQVEVVD